MRKRGQVSSLVLHLGGEGNAIVEEVGIVVVAVDFEDFGDEAATGSPLHLDHDV